MEGKIRIGISHLTVKQESDESIGIKSKIILVGRSLFCNNKVKKK